MKSTPILTAAIAHALLVLGVAAPSIPALNPAHVEKEVGTYPLTICPVSGQKLGSMGAPHVVRHEGREVRFCCKGCVPGFQKEPAKFLATLDAAVEAQQAPTYPLKQCPISGQALGAMGKPFPVVLGNNTLVMLCCKGCVKDALKEAGALEKRVQEARQSLAGS